MHITYSKIEKSALRHLRKYNYLGIVGALVFFCFSLLPSLMPRTWALQAVVSGLSLTFGYGLGLFISAVFRKSIKKTLPTRIRNTAWIVLVYTAPIIIITFLFLGSIWQEEVRQLLQVRETVPFRGLRVFTVAVLMAVSIVWLCKHIVRMSGWLINKLDERLPFRVSVVLGVGATIFLVFWVISGVFFNFFETQAYRIYRAENETTHENITQPDTPNRSGTSESLVQWDDLGKQGQRFIATGPTQSAIADYYGQPSLDPIRVYVGLDSAPSAQERADLVIAEMHRTGAFNRSILVIATPTGTGWFEPKAVDAVEYMHGGDTAIVAQQYSYLPSWVSFLVDKDVASETGRVLFDAVYTELSELPEVDRPQVYTYGLSLGSYGSQAAFSSPSDMLKSIDGAVYQGTLNDTQIWRTIVDNRDAGTPEWQPRYRGGESIRFASTPRDALEDVETWESPRVLYMQHASDPIVWFNFDLIFRKPDWLSEPRGRDVSSMVRWYPFVTFVQVAVDQVAAHSVTDGRGHVYGDTVVEAWRAVTQPDNWNESKKDRLYNALHDR